MQMTDASVNYIWSYASSVEVTYYVLYSHLPLCSTLVCTTTVSSRQQYRRKEACVSTVGTRVTGEPRFPWRRMNGSVGLNDSRQVAMGTQHTPDRPSVAAPEMRHTTTPTWRAPLKRAYDIHFKCPHHLPTHPFPTAPETPDRGTS